LGRLFAARDCAIGLPCQPFSKHLTRLAAATLAIIEPLRKFGRIERYSERWFLSLLGRPSPWAATGRGPGPCSSVSFRRIGSSGLCRRLPQGRSLIPFVACQCRLCLTASRFYGRWFKRFPGFLFRGLIRSGSSPARC